MKRIVFVFTLAMNLFLVSIVFAQDKFTVSGEVVYSKDSNIYVCLHNSTTFAAAMGRQGELPPPSFVNIVKTSVSGKVPFAFNDVLKGEYVILAFADENSNSIMDRDSAGYAIEPRDFYIPTPQGEYSNWNEQKFKVDKNVTGIVLKLH